MLNIMIVEDEPPIARSLKNMIESLSSSYSVLSSARNGREALSLLEHTHEKINVLFTDIRMPVMDGLTLMKDISLDVGFADPLYFSRIFKKETNYSPADYKKLCEQRRK